MGPTMHSPSWSDSTQLDERRVEVKFNIADPGEYQIYAWPEHDECNPFQPELHEWKIRPCEFEISPFVPFEQGLNLPFSSLRLPISRGEYSRSHQYRRSSTG
jgi:hypothetical protein